MELRDINDLEKIEKIRKNIKNTVRKKISKYNLLLLEKGDKLFINNKIDITRKFFF